jgi:deoxyribonuclease V
VKAAHLHSWDVSWAQAEEIQNDLRGRVSAVNGFTDQRYVAGIDLGFRGEMGRAAAVVVDYPGLKLVDLATADRPVTFPYRPGFLSFREAPAAIAALEALTVEPDLLVVDGQGIAHPRRLGIAAHLGVLFDIPTIGCAKSRLVGHFEEPGQEPGSWTPLTDRGEVIGAVVRTKKGSKPLFISIGHRIDLPTAIDAVLHLARGYRLPEPTRLAHLAAAGQVQAPSGR